jgi:hypothetical protein
MSSAPHLGGCNGLIGNRAKAIRSGIVGAFLELLY